MINEYSFDELIVGGSLESLLFSYLSNKHILLVDPLYPIEVAVIDYHANLRFLGYSPEDTIRKSEMWDRLTFLLSMNNLLVCPNIMTSYRTGEKEVTVITEKNRRILFHSENLVFFDNILLDEVVMLDWFNVRSGNNHCLELIKDERNDFINKIYFYTSNRIGGNRNMRDLLALSDLTKTEAAKVDHSEGIARLKVLKMMHDAGIRGQSNGYDKRGKQIHYSLKIEHTYREFRNRYRPKNKIEEILLIEPDKENLWNTAKKLFRHKQISTLQESFRLPANL